MNVQVKKVPDDLHAALRSRARRQGISMNDLLLEMLRRELSRPSMQEWTTRVHELGIDVEADTEQLMDQVRGDRPT